MNKINRKKFIKRAALGAVGAGLLGQSCASESSKAAESGIDRSKKYRWKMVTTWPPNFPVIGEGCEQFSEWVKTMSDGRLDIKVYGAGELIPALECFDAVSNGTVEMSHGCAYYWAGKLPAAQFFGSVPFGLNSTQMNAWIIGGDGLDIWRELYEPFNVIPFPAGNTNVQMGGWFNKEINSIADLKGLKMRIPGIGGNVLERAGGSAVLTAGGEIYTNLERGVIDATEWIGPFHDYKMGFHKIAKYYYSPGWHEAGTCFELGVNKQAYEALPRDLQEIIATASLRLHSTIQAEIEIANSEYLTRMKDEGKVQFRTFPKDVLETFRKHTADIIKELAAEDPKTQKVLDSLNAFRASMRGWSEISEQAYYDLMG